MCGTASSALTIGTVVMDSIEPDPLTSMELMIRGSSLIFSSGVSVIMMKSISPFNKK